MIKIIFFIFSALFAVYLLLPTPASIRDFPALPNSTKSGLSGDTWQVPNVAAYFSDNYRDFVIPFYRDAFIKKSWLGILPLRLNYPPEFAFTAIKDQTQSTYLEEMVYPMKDSLFVNGLEPYTKDGAPRFKGATTFEVGGGLYTTKVTLRYYPSPVWARIIGWGGVLLSMVLLWKLGKKIILKI